MLDKKSHGIALESFTFKRRYIFYRNGISCNERPIFISRVDFHRYKSHFNLIIHQICSVPTSIFKIMPPPPKKKERKKE